MGEPVSLCASCKSPINKGARICPTCRSFQSSWKNLAIFFGGLVGVITLIASGAAYVGSQTVRLLKEVTWRDDIAVISFAGLRDVTIINSGSGPVFVSHIDIFYPSQYVTGNYSDRINTVLLNGQVANKRLDSYPFDENALGTHLANESGSSYDLVRYAGPLPGPTHCFAIRFFDVNHHDVLRMQSHYKEHGKKLIQLRASAAVVFYSQRTGLRHTKAFPVVGVFRAKKDKRCEALAGVYSREEIEFLLSYP